MNLKSHSLTCLIFASWIAVHDASGQFTARQLTNSDGLSNNSVNCFMEDSHHTLWIGTWDGLNSYDGRSVRTYRYGKNMPGSIANNVIRQIVEQDGEHIWIATNYGVSRWNRHTQLFDNYLPDTNLIHSKRVSSPYLISVTSDGHIIVCVKKSGFYLFDAAAERFVRLETPVDPAIRNMIADRYQHLYILDDERRLLRVRVVPSNEGIVFAENERVGTHGEIHEITLSDDMLVASRPDGVTVIDTGSGEIRDVAIEGRIGSRAVYSKERIYTILENGRMIYCNLNNGRTNTIEAFPGELSVFSLYAGSQDIVWIGTDGQGIFQLYEYTSPFRTVTTHYPVRCFSEHDNGTILVGTKGGGIKLFDRTVRNTATSLTETDGLISNSVYSMRKNGYGDIFIGTEGRGINYMLRNETTIRNLRFPPEVAGPRSVYSVHFTENDSVLWAGTVIDGLIRIDLERNASGYAAKKVTVYSSENNNSLNNNTIYSIVRGRGGRSLWVGTRGGGINALDPETGIFNRLEELNSVLTHNDVLSMQYGTDGDLWIGTSYGLNRVNISGTAPSLRGEYTDSDGLANNTIHGIIEDTAGNVWVSTNLGISCIDPGSGKITNYTRSNGLQDNEFSDGAYFMDSRGTIWFGGVGGMSYFNAEEISLRGYSPPLSLIGLKINNVDHNIYDRISDNTLRLAYNEPYITFSFVTGDFINNENCLYSYRIAGFADQWIYNDSNPSVVITKLPPGKYRLEVRHTNGDRVWSEETYLLDITVGYPWWLSWWACLLYLTVLTVIVWVSWVMIRNRVKFQRKLLLEHAAKRNQQRIHESRLNFFTNIAHEFFTPLTLIYGPAQQLLEKGGMDDYARRYVTMIRNNAERMQNLLGELMDFRKAESGHTPLHPEPVEILPLIDFISDNYSEFAEQNRIGFRFETGNLATFVTDRNALEKIIFNLISNAFKYTPANGYIVVRVDQRKDGTFHFSVKNSGRGLTEQQQHEVFDRFRIFESTKREGTISTGVGLNLTKGLVRLMDGTIRVESVPGEYVEFSVLLPPMALRNDPETVPPEPEGRTVTDSWKKLSILIVDDERDIRELLRDILSPHYNVREASDGRKALEEIARNRPDIVITDIVMPEMDGIGLIEAMRSDENTAHIPVIGISAKGEVEDKIAALEHGTDLYITKPFHPRHVLVAVGNVINKHLLLKKYFTSGRSTVTVREGIRLHDEDVQLLREIVSYIETNVGDESLTPTSISEFIGIGKASLYQKLKALTGKTPGEYIRTVRLEHAANLLLTTRLTASEIMYKSGFQSKSYFYKEFARQYGSSPKEYRNLNNPS